MVCVCVTFLYEIQIVVCVVLLFVRDPDCGLCLCYCLYEIQIVVCVYVTFCTRSRLWFVLCYFLYEIQIVVCVYVTFCTRSRALNFHVKQYAVENTCNVLFGTVCRMLSPK